LILTNHHVAFRAIQTASDKEHDYIANGFLAKTKKEEIPAGVISRMYYWVMKMLPTLF